MFHKLSGEVNVPSSSDAAKPMARRRSSIQLSRDASGVPSLPRQQSDAAVGRVKSAAASKAKGKGDVPPPADGSAINVKRMSIIAQPAAAAKVPPKKSPEEEAAAAAAAETRRLARAKQQEELRAKIKESRARIAAGGPRSQGDDDGVEVFVPDKKPSPAHIGPPARVAAIPFGAVQPAAHISPIAAAAVARQPDGAGIRIPSVSPPVGDATIEHGRRAGQTRKPTVALSSEAEAKR